MVETIYIPNKYSVIACRKGIHDPTFVYGTTIKNCLPEDLRKNKHPHFDAQKNNSQNKTKITTKDNFFLIPKRNDVHNYEIDIYYELATIRMSSRKNLQVVET